MATHDYVIANASGAAVRADLNNALAAIVTNNSNATEPATTYPYMLWADTTAGQLKLRNGTDDAWIVLQELDGTLLMEDGTVAAPGLAFASDIDTGFYRPAADQLAVATNGVERVKYGTTEVVFNDGAEDYDFRVEGSTQPSLIATNAGDDTISFGGNITSDTVYDGDVQMASQNGGPLAGFRNKIINGAMQVAQRATSITGTSAALTECRTCDRMVLALNLLGTWDITQNTASPDGFSNSFGLSCSAGEAAPTAAATLILVQRFEGQNLQDLQYGTSGAKAVTLSFWVRSNVTGTASVSFRQVDSSRIYTTTYTVNVVDTWEYKTITVPGDTAGQIDNDNGNGFQIEWWLNSGSTYTGGTTQGWGANVNANRNPSNLGVGGSTNDNFFITGLQLEVSPVATPFEHRPIQTELALCQRYYQDTGGLNNWPVSRFSASSGTGYNLWSYTQTMRAVPTITVNSGAWNSNSGYGGSPTFGPFATDKVIRVSSTSSVAANGVLYLEGPGFNMDAEL
jgi:hypothetical protein